MAKKTKAGQRSKEEQWRRRMAAQARRGAMGTAVADGSETGAAVLDDTEVYEPGESLTATPVSRPAPAQRATRSDPTAQAAAQRRSYSAARASRVRLAANPLTLEEEMHYVRSDIRNLIILTAVCLAVLIVLAFVIH
jgi:hypothetical protein